MFQCESFCLLWKQFINIKVILSLGSFYFVVLVFYVFICFCPWHFSDSKLYFLLLKIEDLKICNSVEATFKSTLYTRLLNEVVKRLSYCWVLRRADAENLSRLKDLWHIFVAYFSCWFQCVLPNITPDYVACISVLNM